MDTLYVSAYPLYILATKNACNWFYKNKTSSLVVPALAISGNLVNVIVYENL